jgi:hypothetical protein
MPFPVDLRIAVSIEISDIGKRFGDYLALDRVSLEPSGL